MEGIDIVLFWRYFSVHGDAPKKNKLTGTEISEPFLCKVCVCVVLIMNT
jgi:hypothetical protein